MLILAGSSRFSARLHSRRAPCYPDRARGHYRLSPVVFLRTINLTLFSGKIRPSEARFFGLFGLSSTPNAKELADAECEGHHRRTGRAAADRLRSGGLAIESIGLRRLSGGAGSRACYPIQLDAPGGERDEGA